MLASTCFYCRHDGIGKGRRGVSITGNFLRFERNEVEYENRRSLCEECISKKGMMNMVNSYEFINKFYNAM